MATRSLDIIIGGKNRLGPVTASVRASLAGIASTAATVRNALLGMFAPIAAGFTLGKILEQSAEAEKVLGAFAASLDLLGKGGDEAVRDMQAFATSIQRVTTLGDEAVLQIATIGVNLGKFSGQQLKDATVAAIGLSRRLGIDAPDAMKLLAKAAQGQTSTFSRYGIVLKDTMTDQEKFNHVLAIGTDSFKLATAEANTMIGKWTQLKEVIGDFAETVGGILTPVLLPLVEGATNAIVNFSQRFAFELAVIEFSLTNFRDILQLVVTESILFWVRLGAEIAHGAQVAVQMITWVGQNVAGILGTLLDFLKAMLGNAADNLFNFFAAVARWMKGDGFDFKWTALEESFRLSISELPKILDREKGPLEKYLEDMVVKLGDGLGRKWVDFMRDRLKIPRFDPGAQGEPAKVPGSEGKASTPKAFDPNPTAQLLQSRFITGSIQRDPSMAVHQQTSRNTAETNRHLADANRKWEFAARTLSDMYRLMLKPPTTSSDASF
jgi:hypothetical protein